VLVVKHSDFSKLARELPASMFHFISGVELGKQKELDQMGIHFNFFVL
jgi:hypothetical protein